MSLTDVERPPLHHFSSLPCPSLISVRTPQKKDLTMAICSICSEHLSMTLTAEHVFELSCGHFCHLECLYVLDNLSKPYFCEIESSPQHRKVFCCKLCGGDVTYIDPLAVEKANAHHAENGCNISSKMNTSPNSELMDFDVILDSRPSSSESSFLLNEKFHPSLKFDVCKEQLIMKLETPGIDEELYSRKLTEMTDYVSQFSDIVGKVVIYDKMSLKVNGLHLGLCLCVLLEQIFLAIDEMSIVVVEISISDLSPKITVSPYGFTILPTNYNYPEIQMLTNPTVAHNWEAHLERLVLALDLGGSYSLSESTLRDSISTIYSSIHANIILCISAANCTNFSNEEYGVIVKDCIRNTLASLGANDRFGLVLVGQNFKEKHSTLGTYTGLANATWDGWDIILQELEIYDNTLFITQYDELLLKVEKCQQLMDINQIQNSFGNSVNKVLFVGLSDLKEGLREHDLIAECMMSLKEICSLHFVNLSSKNAMPMLQSWLEKQKLEYSASSSITGINRVDYNWMSFHSIIDFEKYDATFVSSLFKTIAFPAVSVSLTYDVEDLDQPGIFEKRKQTICIHDLPSGFSKEINWGFGVQPTKLEYSISWLKLRVTESITF